MTKNGFIVRGLLHNSGLIVSWYNFHVTHQPTKAVLDIGSIPSEAPLQQACSYQSDITCIYIYVNIYIYINDISWYNLVKWVKWETVIRSCIRYHIRFHQFPPLLRQHHLSAPPQGCGPPFESPHLICDPHEIAIGDGVDPQVPQGI